MKKRWVKIVGAIVGVVIALVVIVVIAAWERIIPVIVRARMESQIADVWEGPVKVSGVRFGYGGELNVSGIYLGDRQGRECVRVEGLKVGLERWPSMSPSVRAVDVNRVDIKMYFAEGKCLMPLEIPEKRKEAAAEAYEGVKIPDITIGRGSIALSQVGGPTVVYDNIRVSVRDQNDAADIYIVREGAGAGEEFSLKGGISTRTGDADIRVKVAHRVTEDEGAILLALAAPKGGYRAAGQLNMDCRFEGPIVARQNMTMEGQASIVGGSVSNPAGEIAGDINAKATMKGQRVDVESLAARVAGGQVSGKGFADHVLAYPIDYGGDVRAENMDLPKLAAAFGSTGKLSRGAVGGEFAFTGTSKGIGDLNGELAANLRGAELTAMPAMGVVFKTIGLGKYDPSAATDAEGRFKVTGAVLTVEDAQVSSTLGAIKVEPGGTYNLQTRDIDAYVVAVPLAEVQEAIERVPVGDLLMKFKDRLVRLHLKGNLNEPDKLVTKEPTKDIGEITEDVLKGAVETGKGVGEGVLDGIKGILGGGDKKKEQDK